jgi:hypothetical protein
LSVPGQYLLQCSQPPAPISQERVAEEMRRKWVLGAAQ